MHTLLLMRHAKAAAPKPGLDDFDRPLNERGRAAAPLMGEYLAAIGLTPARILCSAAQRTRETLAGLLPHFPRDLDVRIMRDLYDAGATDLVDAVAAFGGSKATVLVIGHNPSIQSAATRLAATGDPALRQAVAADFPTGAVAAITFATRNWKTVRETGGELAGFWKPRELLPAAPDA